MRYGGETSISGDFAAVQWEHNFSEDLQAEMGVAAWDTRGMSQWMFEDVGIDFLEGLGLKWYAAVSDRISDNLLVYAKCRHKVSDFPHTGLGNSDGLHFGGGVEQAGDFVSRNDRFDVALQIDLLW
jgi:hypothetical protein